MRTLKLKGIGIFGGMVLLMLAGLAIDASAQSRRDIERERERYEREQRQYERQNRRRDRDRRYDRRRSQNDRAYFPGSRHGGMSANTRQGYEQGLIAGQNDARKRKYNRSNVYRNTGSYPNNGDPTSADYLYRQAYLQGYNDGYNGRRNY